MAKPNGIILYEGPSKLDGEPIVAVATLKSANVKTGNMVQTWIIRSDMDPVSVSKSKLDGSICGSCPHRQSLGGACYVNIGQAPNGVYKAYKRGKYPTATPELLDRYITGRFVRFGAYGDPAAVPVDVWADLADRAKGWTGYTHQARNPNFDPAILQYCMESVDTPRQAMKEQAKGHRTFRVKTPDAPFLDGEIECPADSKGTTCAECRLCDGMAGEGPNIAITVHGAVKSRYEAKYHNANLIAVS